MVKIISYFLVSLYLYSCSQHKYGETKYELSNDTINFGKVNYCDTLIKDVYLKNFSSKGIKILVVENGCGCTSEKISDSIIKINDSIRIQVSYIPSLSKDHGMVTKYLTLRTNSDPPFRNIVIKGEVQ